MIASRSAPVDRSAEVYSLTVARSFSFLKRTARLDDLFAKSVPRGLCYFVKQPVLLSLQQASSPQSAQLPAAAQHRLHRPPTSSRTTLM